MRITAIAGGRILASFAQALNLLILARGASVESFGAFSALFGMTAFFNIATDFGLSSMVLKERAMRPGSSVVQISAWMSYLGSTAVAIFATVVWLAAFREPISTVAAIGLGAFVGLDRLAEFWTALAVADGRERAATTSMVLRRLVPLVGGLLALWLNLPLDPLSIYAWLSAVTALGMVFYVPRRLPHPPPPLRPTIPAFRAVVRQGLPFWISTTASQSRDLEGWVVSRAADLTATANLSVATRLARPFLLISQAVAQPLLPMAAKKDVRFARRAILIVFFAGLALSAAALLALPLLPPLILALLGESYLGAVPVSSIAVASAGILATATPLGAILQARGHQTTVAWVGATTNVLSLAALGAVTHFYGLEIGVAISAGVLAVKSVSYLGIGLSRTRIQPAEDLLDPAP